MKRSMLRRPDLLFWLLAAIILSRLGSMVVFPMVDTTEARYGEVARIMAETGDWITPWFNYGVPFWGKPPLSFWLEAFSMRLFGITEFAARLPSWLAHLGMAALIFTAMLKMAGKRQALIATLVFSSMALSYILSGAVLTDPFLALGTTLSLVSIILALRQPGSLWRWWFFIGLVIGLLAKGPLALVLIGGPLFLWVLWRRRWRDLGEIPWIRGLLLTALLSLPWYVAAELKTPGFINYFIVGEHFLRFVDPGWSGDLYGSAHKEAFGTIWLYWIAASFPWGLIGIGVLIWRWLASKRGDRPISGLKLDDEQRLLLLAALFPSLFFTFSGNILWTYQLPALVPLAMLLGQLMANASPVTAFRKYGMITVTAMVPLAVILIGFYAHFYPDKLSTEKALVAYYDEHKGDDAWPLIYIGKPPFSARFYSRGHVTPMALPEVKSLLSSKTDAIYFLAIRNNNIGKVIHSLPGQVEIKLRNSRFTLVQIAPASDEIAQNMMGKATAL